MNGQQTSGNHISLGDDDEVERKSNPEDDKASSILAEKRSSIVLSLREHDDPPLEAKLKRSFDSRNSLQSKNSEESSGKYPMKSNDSKSKSYGIHYSNDVIPSICTY